MIILLFTFSNCKQKNNAEEFDNYNKKATELITQIFSDEYYDCSCIVKTKSDENLIDRIELEMPALNFRKKTTDILNVNRESTLDSLIRLSEHFKLKNSMFRSKTKLIEQRQFDSIKNVLESIAKNGTEKEIETAFRKCPTDFYFLSKPLFDKNFKIAIIDINLGFVHTRTHPRIYRLKHGIWEQD